MTSAGLDTRSIVLTGFMGTGKSTIGRLVAAQLGFDFVDTDVLIEERHGPIATIFARQGEDAFRSIEREIAAELAAARRLVVATGGRLMLDPANVASLGRNGRVYCLVATPEEILERVTGDSVRVERPLLAVADPFRRIVDLLAERGPDYRRFAQLDTTGRSPEVVAGDIVALATSDPEAFAVVGPGGSWQLSVGTALLPFVRQLAGIDGALVVVTDVESARLHLPSCPTPDLVVTLASGPRGPDVLDAARHQVHDALTRLGSATIMSLGDRGVAVTAASAAATYRGGVDLVHCPTDLIAMVTAVVDEAHRQPRAVVADVATVQALDRRHFSAGMVEVLKWGLIGAAALVDGLEQGEWHTGEPARPPALLDLRTLVVATAQIVAETRLEARRRDLLGLGQDVASTFGLPDMERLDREQAVHGESLALGLIATCRLSALLGHCPVTLAGRVERLIESLGVPTTLPPTFDPRAASRSARRQAGGRRLVLLRDVGDPFVATEVPDAALLEVLESLQT